MSFLKCLGWAAAGVAAVVAAPVTGGGSIAAVIGALGTTTAAGAAIGAAGGLGAKAIFDAAADDSGDKVNYYKSQAETNKAGWTESERKREEQAQKHKVEVAGLNEKIAKLLTERESMLEELRSRLFTRTESELMFTIAAAVAHADKNSSQEEFEAAAKAISLLCSEPEDLTSMCTRFFDNPVSIEEAKRKIIACKEMHSLQRIGFVLDMVVYADEYVSPDEEELICAFKQHYEDLEVAV